MKLRKPIVAPRLIKFISKLQGINLSGWFFFPWIFVNREEPPKLMIDWQKWRYTVRHESIHWYQCAECLIIGFVLIYFFSWLYGLIKYRSFEKAYRNVVFEKEAYQNQENYNYSKTRKLFAWTKYF